MDLKTAAELLNSRQFPIAWPGQWIGGEWVLPRRGPVRKFSQNPNDGTLLMEVWLDKESINAAIQTAYQARAKIGALPIAERLALLRQYRQALADYQQPLIATLRIEAGKPRWEAEDDIGRAIKYLDWVSQNADVIHEAMLAPARLGPHRGGKFAMLPIGVTGAYLPFSTPVTTFAFYFAAALLAGCPLLLNSSSHSLLSATFFALLAREAALPPEMLTVVFGNFSSFRQIIADKRVAAILYTGSREHCDLIRTESRQHVGRQVVLQSGGKNAVIVDPSADLDLAVKCVVYGALKSAGQRCTSTSRVFVQRTVGPAFREALTAAFKNVPVGRTDQPDTPAGGRSAGSTGPFMGPLYSDKAVEKYLRFQTMANREAEKTLLWGRVLESEAKGFFVTPSLHHLARFDNQSAFQGNVLFSPNVAVYDYDNLEIAIDQINTTDAAFAVSFLGDPAVINAKRHMFLAPNLLVNTPTIELEATLPLAGRLQSGHHRFHGPGIALYLCYSQVVSQDSEAENLIKTWPWPGFKL